MSAPSATPKELALAALAAAPAGTAWAAPVQPDIVSVDNGARPTRRFKTTAIVYAKSTGKSTTIQKVHCPQLWGATEEECLNNQKKFIEAALK